MYFVRRAVERICAMNNDYILTLPDLLDLNYMKQKALEITPFQDKELFI